MKCFHVKGLFKSLMLAGAGLLLTTNSSGQTGIDFVDKSRQKAVVKRSWMKLKKAMETERVPYHDDTLTIVNIDLNILQKFGESDPSLYKIYRSIFSLQLHLGSTRERIQKNEKKPGYLDEEVPGYFQQLEHATDSSFLVEPFRQEIAFYERHNQLYAKRQEEISDSIAKLPKEEVVIDGSDIATVKLMANSVKEYNGQFWLRRQSRHKHLVLFANTHPFWLNELYLFLQDRGWEMGNVAMVNNASQVTMVGPCNGCAPKDRPVLKVTAAIDSVKNATKSVVITGTQRSVVQLFVAYWNQSDVNTSTKAKTFYYNASSDRVVLEGKPGVAVIRIIPNPNVGYVYKKDKEEGK